MSLTHKSLSAVFWSGADIFLRQGLVFFVSIILARLLSPEQFGTIALLYLFTGIANAFVDSGFSAALVQQQETTHTDESTVFWFNLIMGALVAILLWLLAPLFAQLYGLPILIPLTAVLAINVFVSALGSIHSTLLTKHLEFKVQMKIGAIATVLSGVVAIVMAMKGFGVWALAAQFLVVNGTTTLLLWALNRWRPAFVFSLESARRLFGFGGYLLAAGLLDVTYNRIYSLLIGKFYGVRDLGFYSRAESTKQLPVVVLTGILSRVAFPIFSAVGDDKLKLRRGVRLAIRSIMLINVPMMLGLAVVAEPLVLTLFGANWLPVVPTLQILCLGGVFWPLHVINLNVLAAQGHSHLFFQLEIVKKVLGMALLAIGAFYGVMGIAWSQAVFGVLAFAINSYYTQRYLDYGLIPQVRDFIPILAIALPMVWIVHWFSNQLQLTPVLALINLVTLGILVFFALGWAFRLAALKDVHDLFHHHKVSVLNP